MVEIYYYDGAEDSVFNVQISGKDGTRVATLQVQRFDSIADLGAVKSMFEGYMEEYSEQVRSVLKDGQKWKHILALGTLMAQEYLEFARTFKESRGASLSLGFNEVKGLLAEQPLSLKELGELFQLIEGDSIALYNKRKELKETFLLKVKRLFRADLLYDERGVFVEKDIGGHVQRDVLYEILLKDVGINVDVDIMYFIPKGKVSNEVLSVYMWVGELLMPSALKLLRVWKSEAETKKLVKNLEEARRAVVAAVGEEDFASAVYNMTRGSPVTVMMAAGMSGFSNEVLAMCLSEAIKLLEERIQRGHKLFLKYLAV